MLSNEFSESDADYNSKKVDVSKFGFDPYENKRAKEDIYNSQFNALQLFERNIVSIPKLIEPFYQKVGLAALVGESDCGKSTFLTQMALSIALGKKEFLNFKINSNTNKVIYVSTEDDPNSLTVKIKKQLSIINKFDKTKLKNLDFIFNTENIVEKLDQLMLKNKGETDLIIVDAFSDVFTGEVNSSKDVRNFLNKYDDLAKKYNCLIVMLHHIKKGSERYINKNSIIGSQSFEAKMRSTVHLSPHKKEYVKLSITKGNFISDKQKDIISVLSFKNQTFHNTGQDLKKSDNTISQDKDVLNLIKKHYTTLKSKDKFNSVRDVTKLLEGTPQEVKSTVVGEIVKKNGDELKKIRESILKKENSFNK